MAKATALARARRVRQYPKPEPQSAQIGPDGPKHPGNRQLYNLLYNKRGCPDAGARLHADYPKPKVATFCAALWLTFTLPLTFGALAATLGRFVRNSRTVSPPPTVFIELSTDRRRATAQSFGNKTRATPMRNTSENFLTLLRPQSLSTPKPLPWSDTTMIL